MVLRRHGGVVRPTAHLPWRLFSRSDADVLCAVLPATVIRQNVDLTRVKRKQRVVPTAHVYVACSVMYDCNYLHTTSVEWRSGKVVSTPQALALSAQCDIPQQRCHRCNWTTPLPHAPGRLLVQATRRFCSSIIDIAHAHAHEISLPHTVWQPTALLPVSQRHPHSQCRSTAGMHIKATQTQGLSFCLLAVVAPVHLAPLAVAVACL